MDGKMASAGGLDGEAASGGIMFDCVFESIASGDEG